MLVRQRVEAAVVFTVVIAVDAIAGGGHLCDVEATVIVAVVDGRCNMVLNLPFLLSL